MIILPTSLMLTVVGLLESMMTATIVDRFAVHDDPAAVEKLMGGH